MPGGKGRRLPGCLPPASAWQPFARIAVVAPLSYLRHLIESIALARGSQFGPYPARSALGAACKRLWRIAQICLCHDG